MFDFGELILNIIFYGVFYTEFFNIYNNLKSK
jgi:hypothetical protein